jgi:hypothetical protein
LHESVKGIVEGSVRNEQADAKRGSGQSLADVGEPDDPAPGGVAIANGMGKYKACCHAPGNAGQHQ